jgi:ATP-binding cassette subfamily F protein uup
VLREYVGGYSDWQRQRSQPLPKQPDTRPPAGKVAVARREKQKAVRLTYKERRELDALPAAIAALEQEQSEITTQLADPDLYRDQPERVHALQQRYSAIEAALMQSLTRWEELEARQAASDKT